MHILHKIINIFKSLLRGRVLKAAAFFVLINFITFCKILLQGAYVEVDFLFCIK